MTGDCQQEREEIRITKGADGKGGHDLGVVGGGGVSNTNARKRVLDVWSGYA